MSHKSQSSTTKEQNSIELTAKQGVLLNELIQGWSKLHPEQSLCAEQHQMNLELAKQIHQKVIDCKSKTKLDTPKLNDDHTRWIRLLESIRNLIGNDQSNNLQEDIHSLVVASGLKKEDSRDSVLFIAEQLGQYSEASFITELTGNTQQQTNLIEKISDEILNHQALAILDKETHTRQLKNHEKLMNELDVLMNKADEFLLVTKQLSGSEHGRDHKFFPAGKVSDKPDLKESNEHSNPSPG